MTVSRDAEKAKALTELLKKDMVNRHLTEAMGL